jgi:hypothetical protein
MIKFGVLRADADGISLIGLHFVEVRQDSLCWRTSALPLAYFAQSDVRRSLPHGV